MDGRVRGADDPAMSGIALHKGRANPPRTLASQRYSAVFGTWLNRNGGLPETDDILSVFQRVSGEYDNIFLPENSRSDSAQLFCRGRRATGCHALWTMD
jgi:hypothetical protein